MYLSNSMTMWRVAIAMAMDMKRGVRAMAQIWARDMLPEEEEEDEEEDEKGEDVSSRGPDSSRKPAPWTMLALSLR